MDTNIEIKHFVYVPTSNCVIVTAKEKERNRIKVYLILTGEHQRRIYQRNGINQTWDELDSLKGGRIQKLVCDAFSDERIPRYCTSVSALN